MTTGSGKINLENIIVIAIVAVFVISATVASYIAFGDMNGVEQNDAREILLIAAIAKMAIAGVALTSILLFKLQRQKDFIQEKQKIMGFLEPRIAAMEASMDGIVITDREGNIKYANRSLALLHGYDDSSELMEQNWKSLYAPEQAEIIEKQAMLELLQQWHWRGQCKGLRKDGKEYAQDLSMTLLADGGYVWIVRDNTEVIENINLSNQRLAAIEAAGDGIGIVDKDGNLSFINKALMDLHGIEPEELDSYIGHPWENLYNEKGREQINGSVMPILKKEGYWKGDSLIMSNDGNLVHAEMSLTALPDGGLIGTARNITDRKVAEKEKEALQEQFFQAQKMEAVGRLAGGIAHDFNNILAAILGYTEFLLEDLDENSRQYSYSSKIMGGGVQAKNLVEQILAFSRRQDSTKEAIDVVESIEETQNMLSATLPATTEIKVEHKNDSLFVKANRTQLGQVIMNLCVNATDAMPNEQGELLISSEACVPSEIEEFKSMIVDRVPEADGAPLQRFVETDDGHDVLQLGFLAKGTRYVMITVSDDGSGISRDVMEKMFEPFFTTKPVNEGTGLGLSSVHGIVIGHKGAIIVSSKVDEGSVFRIFLPELDQNAELNAAKEEKEQRIMGEGNVLVVEDQAHVRDMLTNMIGRMGYKVEACRSGDEAIDILRENIGKYDVVVSDFVMPKMTGGELAAAIAEDFPELPVILISGYNKKKIQNLMDENKSIKAFMPKPVESAKLSKVIHDILKESRKAA